MPFESVNGIVPTGRSIDGDEVYDLRSVGLEDGETILSSAQSSSNHGHLNSRRNIYVDIPDMALSLTPSMVDSSVLVPNETSTTGSSLSGSFLSSSDIISMISSCDAASHSTPHDDVFAISNVGRSLMLASVSSDTTARSENDINDTVPSKSKSTGMVMGAVGWWDNLKTDEDWDMFRTKANEYLNVLIAEEVKRLKNSGVGTEFSVDKTTIINGGGAKYRRTDITHSTQQQKQQQLQGLLKWFKAVYDSINATIEGITSSKDCDSLKTRYFSTLMEEIVDVQQKLEQLPPMPPSLPEELLLDELPTESRDILIQYRERLDAWRREVVPQHEVLTSKYVNCQEKLLSIIIDTEEEVFYNRGSGGDNSCLGEINDDGYIAVADKQSHLWDGVDDQLYTPSQSKFQVTTFLLAALTAGASFFVAMQAKRK